MGKVDFIKLNSANVSADNSIDTEKKYDITANVNINGRKVNSVDAGRVVKGGIEVTVEKLNEDALTNLLQENGWKTKDLDNLEVFV